MRIALHNIHRLPLNLEIHGYVLELLRQRLVSVLYFSDRSGLRFVKTLYRLARSDDYRRKFQSIDWNEFEFVFTPRQLSRQADVLLNLNLMYMPKLTSELGSGVSRFDGLKIFHVGDYFWYHPGTEINGLLQGAGVDHLFGYAMHDRHCEYFYSHFPKYRGKVWGIPFGFAPRFRSVKPFATRLNKTVAVGSVNPLRPLHEAVHNYRETADFFMDECWFHKFRRQLVLNKRRLADVMDSMLPEFPVIKDFRYDLVAKFNEYRMFVTCESIYWFPSAKVFEGPACGAALICADHDSLREYGFVHGQNCIMYQQYDLDDFQSKVASCQHDEARLTQIASQGHAFVTTNYSHKSVAAALSATTKLIWDARGNVNATPLASRLQMSKPTAPTGASIGA